MTITLHVNGRDHTLEADPSTPLLYVLRDDLELNGAKYGCGLGQCGACTVVIDGSAEFSCITPISALAGRRVTTIEGLGTVEEPPFYGIELHPAGGSSAGLLTNAHAQVIHQRRRPIPGLYASGNAASATEQGVGYQAGLSLASSMTFSYLATRHMLGSDKAD